MKIKQLKTNILDQVSLIENPITKLNEIYIENYGIYRIGLLFTEVDKYIEARCNLPQYKRKFKDINKVIKKFWEISGSNTCGMTPDNKSLMYRWDVSRFANVIFDRKDTYFD